MDPVDLRRCSDPDRDEENSKLEANEAKKTLVVKLPIQISKDFKDCKKSPGTALNAVHAVLLKKSFKLGVVLRKDALHLVQVHLRVEIFSEYPTILCECFEL